MQIGMHYVFKIEDTVSGTSGWILNYLMGEVIFKKNTQVVCNIMRCVHFGIHLTLTVRIKSF